MVLLQAASSNYEIQTFGERVQLIQMKIVIYAREMAPFCHCFILGIVSMIIQG